ncbi:MAG: hypothetical protein QM490_02810 [Candidatus Gracilibacteria bacterium]
MKYLEKINKLDKNNILSLDEIVLCALELFQNKKINKLDISGFKKPLIVGSGNAIVTAKIIFSGTNALFCDETNFDKYIEKDIDGLIITSASGEKHAVEFAKKATKKGIKTKLLTCNPNSGAGNILGKNNTIVTQKNREPYTYNTSTYLGWVLAITGEKASNIMSFIQSDIDPIINKIDFGKYDSYLLATPDKYSSVNQLFIVKFIELFGRKIARDVFSYEQLKHAITVIPHDKELAISFGNPNFDFKSKHINIPLPNNCDLGAIMAIGYYVIGKIQNSHPQYFKENIGNYIDDINKTNFGKNMKVIV